MTHQTQHLLQRLAEGDMNAQAEIIHYACERLKGLTRKMLQGYSRLSRWEETDDIHQQAMLRLHQSLAQVKPTSARHFYGLAATQIRRTLIDLVRHYYGPEGLAENHHTDDDKAEGRGQLVAQHYDQSHEPKTLSRWRDFHESIENLPDDEREVFQLLYYDGMTQAEAAGILGIAEKTVRKRWYAARLSLHLALGPERPE